MSPSDGAAEARRALAKAREEQGRRLASVPSIHLLVYANRDGMNVSLALHHQFTGGRRTCEVLRTATFRPSEITPEKMVDWARRACADWLAEPTIQGTTRGPWPVR